MSLLTRGFGKSETTIIDPISITIADSDTLDLEICDEEEEE